MILRSLSLVLFATCVLGARSAGAQCDREDAALQRCRETDSHGLEDCQDRCVLGMRSCMAPLISRARSLLRQVRSGSIGPNAAERRQEALTSRSASCEEARDDCNSRCEESENDRCGRFEASRNQCQERVDAERNAAAEVEARRVASEQAQQRQRNRETLVAAVDAIRAETANGELLGLLDRVDGDAIGDETLRASLRERVLWSLVSAGVSEARRQRETGDLDGCDRTLEIVVAHVGRLPTNSLRRPVADGDVARERLELSAARERARDVDRQRQLSEARTLETRGEWSAARSVYVQLISDRRVGVQASEGIVRLNGHRRSPAVASVLSMLIPGSGQMYAGRGWRGFGFMLGTAAAFTGGALLYLQAEQRYAQYQLARDSATAANRYDETRQFWVGSIVALGVGSILWLCNVLDARGSASAWNEEVVGSND